QTPVIRILDAIPAKESGVPYAVVPGSDLVCRLLLEKKNGCTSAGRSTTCARLIAKTFELGGGRSCTVILRMTPGASLVQSLIAALPVRTAPFSAAAPVTTTRQKTAAKKIARKIGSLDRRAF